MDILLQYYHKWEDKVNNEIIFTFGFCLYMDMVDNLYVCVKSNLVANCATTDCRINDGLDCFMFLVSIFCECDDKVMADNTSRAVE